MKRHTDDESVGLPFGDQRGDRVERGSPMAAIVRNGVAARVTVLPAATPTRLGAEIESEKRTGAEPPGGAIQPGHACPASPLSMFTSMPSSDSALS